jgi:hypothetical protein
VVKRLRELVAYTLLVGFGTVAVFGYGLHAVLVPGVCGDQYQSGHLVTHVSHGVTNGGPELASLQVCSEHDCVIHDGRNGCSHSSSTCDSVCWLCQLLLQGKFFRLLDTPGQLPLPICMACPDPLAGPNGPRAPPTTG